MENHKFEPELADAMDAEMAAALAGGGSTAPGASGGEIAIPTGNLTVEDEGGSAAPGEGDSLTVTITGTVARADGGMTYLRPDTINGKPVSAGAQPEDDGAALEQMAAQSMMG